MTDFSNNQGVINGKCTQLIDQPEQLQEYMDDITVKGLDITGASVVYNLRGVDAACVQHEVDHLNGILLPERVS